MSATPEQLAEKALWEALSLSPVSTAEHLFAEARAELRALIARAERAEAEAGRLRGILGDFVSAAEQEWLSSLWSNGEFWLGELRGALAAAAEKEAE